MIHENLVYHQSEPIRSDVKANARNVSFSISVRWSMYIINSIDKPYFRSVISSVNLFSRSCEDLVISVVFIKTFKIHLETYLGYFLLWPENSRKPL